MTYRDQARGSRYLTGVLLAGSVAACSVFGAGNDSSPTDGAHAGAPPLTGSPSEDELTERFGVFVSTKGTPDGDGSRARPVASIARGIELAGAQGKRVYVCNGTYAEAVTLVDGVSLVGGFDCDDAQSWKKTDARSVIDAASSPALRADAIAHATRVEALDVRAPDATAPGTSAIALLVTDSASLTVANCRLSAGAGEAGASGTGPLDLANGAAFAGLPGHLDGNYCANRPAPLCASPILPTPPAGGVGDCGGGVTTEAGGAGGSGGVYKSQYGVAGWDWVPQGSFGTLAAKPGEARAGGDGAPGTDGTTAQASVGALTREGYVPADGTPGTDGAVGQGGRGGDGMAPRANPAAFQGELWEGVTGGSGGAGGCPGLAGTPGKGGGASVAALLFASPVRFEGCVVVASAGGGGGQGTLGSMPTAGGTAGITPYGIPMPVVAAPGGRGGPAGFSGSGAGGPSLGIAHTGKVPVVEGTSVTVGAGGAGAPELRATDRAGYDRLLPASAAGLAAADYPF